MRFQREQYIQRHRGIESVPESVFGWNWSIEQNLEPREKRPESGAGPPPWAEGLEPDPGAGLAPGPLWSCVVKGQGARQLEARGQGESGFLGSALVSYADDSAAPCSQPWGRHHPWASMVLSRDTHPPKNTSSADRSRTAGIPAAVGTKAGCQGSHDLGS